MKYTVVIPARYASMRLPGKPLLDIAGKSMVQRVYEQATRSSASRVIVATDDDRILKAAKNFGAEVMMTRNDHLSGTDRLEEVARTLGLADDEIIVNVQGDEPLLPASLIEQVANNLDMHPVAGVATLCERLHDLDTVFNPNAVKVVFSDQGFASYFSRAPIPWARDAFAKDEKYLPENTEYYRHIGMYAYRASFLKQYVLWSPSMTEQSESLEQLRALSHGVPIHIEVAHETPPAGVDTPEDLARVRHHFSQS